MIVVFGVIAEDPTDIEILQVLIRRLSNNSSLRIKGKGYGGCGEMLQKGAKQLQLFADFGCKRFVVCYDADGPNAKSRQQEAMEKIISPSKLPAPDCLALVPVQEIEAWILADLDQAVPHVIPSWKPAPISGPESISSPKEHLTQLSRGSNKKPRYAYTIHNPQVARYLNLQTVSRKCPSFRPLEQFVAGHRKIKRPNSSFPGPNTRSLWVYVDPGGIAEYQKQLATAHDWGTVISYVQGLDKQPVELTRLCEYGWADLLLLDEEVQSILTGSHKPKGKVRTVLTGLRQFAETRQDAQYIGLDDGTR